MNARVRLIKAGLANLTMGGALVFSAVSFAAPNPSFNIIGHIESFTLDSATNVTSAAKMTVRGIPITIPQNLLFVMPGRYLTAHDIFRWNPKRHDFCSSNSAAGQCDKTPQDSSGLALKDTLPPAIPFEAEIIGNIVNGNYIAGVVHITQGALHVTAGTILNIDKDTGEFMVGSAASGSAVKVRLNDPDGIYGPSSKNTNLDQRFALDPENSPVHAKTGFPVCLPRKDDPTKCPDSNRPAPGASHFRFTCAGLDGSGAPASATAPSETCDPSKPVPLAEGDYVTLVGMLAKGADGNYFIAAHGLDAELGIYTSPGADPAYIFIEEALQGTKGERFDIPQEETTRFRIVGFTTDPTRHVEIKLIDSGLDEEGISLSGINGLTPSNGPQLGRFRDTWPSKENARAVRRDVKAQIVGVSPKPLTNLLTPGLYIAPISEYIYPEVTQFGSVAAGTPGAFPVPVPFENFCFLKRANATVKTLDNITLGALVPFPDSGHAQSQTKGNSKDRVCGD